MADISPNLSKSRFLELAGQPEGIPPLYCPIPFVEPARLYPAFAGLGTILLESNKGPMNIARYGFLAFDPVARYRLKDGVSLLDGKPTEGHPLSVIRELSEGYHQRPDPGLPPFQGGALGLMSYDFVRYLERIPARSVDDLGIPDADFFVYRKLFAFDYELKKAWAVVCPTPEGYDQAVVELHAMVARAVPVELEPPKEPAPVEVIKDTSQERYVEMVRAAKEFIAAGDIFQANISLRLHAPMGQATPWDLYRTLRVINPAPFACFLEMGDYQIASSSPERLLRVMDGLVDTRPIAGTRPRGKDLSEDDAMRSELLLNEKERAEHIMLIDLERNDLGKVCAYGTVEVDELMTTEDYSHVIHIVSNVKGRLAPGRTPVSALRATFPGGTITGVPKVRCMEIIDELEPYRRGPYTGGVGHVGFGGAMDFNIIIRTFTIVGGNAYVQAGAGVVADSDPVREYHESMRKAEALIKTLGACLR